MTAGGVSSTSWAARLNVLASRRRRSSTVTESQGAPALQRRHRARREQEHRLAGADGPPGAGRDPDDGRVDHGLPAGEGGPLADADVVGGRGPLVDQQLRVRCRVRPRPQLRPAQARPVRGGQHRRAVEEAAGGDDGDAVQGGAALDGRRLRQRREPVDLPRRELADQAHVGVAGQVRELRRSAVTVENHERRDRDRPDHEDGDGRPLPAHAADGTGTVTAGRGATQAAGQAARPR